MNRTWLLRFKHIRSQSYCTRWLQTKAVVETLTPFMGPVIWPPFSSRVELDDEVEVNFDGA